MKQNNKTKNKRKKELKALKKKNKMIYSIAKKTGSHREIKNTKKIEANATKKRRNDRSDSPCNE